VAVDQGPYSTEQVEVLGKDLKFCSTKSDGKLKLKLIANIVTDFLVEKLAEKIFVKRYTWQYI